MVRKRVLTWMAAPSRYIRRSNDELIDPGPYRSQFDRDRDRILYSRCFRRLSRKTQVFLHTSDDHIRTRLTHSLEVSQIAMTIARALGLDLALTEAIALGHDIGHTPFGHAGERALSRIMCGCDRVADFQQNMEEADKGFKHNLQGVRTACLLEQLYGRDGLNLSNFALWGIRNHTKLSWNACHHWDSGEQKCRLQRDASPCTSPGGMMSVGFYQRYTDAVLTSGGHEAWSFEGLAVRAADEIAQRHHDVEDALFRRIVLRDDLTDQLRQCFENHFDTVDKAVYGQLLATTDDAVFMSYLSKLLVGMLNRRLIDHSKENLEVLMQRMHITSRRSFVKEYPEIDPQRVSAVIAYPPELAAADQEFHQFLRTRVLQSFDAERMDGKGTFVIRRLFKAYLTNPRQLYDKTIYGVFRALDPETYRKPWLGVTRAELGDLRNEIDSASNRASQRFQIALLRAICDHIAGMTDNFAMDEYGKLYG